MIKSGEKPIEYREITPYYACRLMACFSSDKEECMAGRCAECFTPENCWCNRTSTEAHFSLGYPKRDDLSRRFTLPVKRIDIGTANPEWVPNNTPADKQFFRIQLLMLKKNHE